MRVSTLVFWIIAVLFFAIFIIVLSMTIPDTLITPIYTPIPGLGPCTPLENLVDVSNEQCCVIGGKVSTLRYSHDLNAVVGPTATLWTQACNTLSDEIEVSQCLEDLYPDLCNSKAAAQARIGITRYYVRNYGDTGCQTRTTCDF